MIFQKPSILFIFFVCCFYFSNVKAQCDVTINPSSTSICNGNSVTLVASGNNSTWEWTPSSGLNITSGNTVIASPSTTTTYSVTRTCDNNETATETVTVNVTQLNVNAGTDILVCKGNISKMKLIW